MPARYGNIHLLSQQSRQRQVKCCESFKASTDYIATYWPAKATEQDPTQNKTGKREIVNALKATKFTVICNKITNCHTSS